MADPRKPPGPEWDPAFDDAEIFVEQPTAPSLFSPLPEDDDGGEVVAVDDQMEITDQQTLANGVLLRRRCAPLPDRWRVKLQVFDGTHLRPKGGELFGQRHTALEDESKQHEIEIAVERSGSRSIGHRQGRNGALERVSAAMGYLDRETRQRADEHEAAADTTIVPEHAPESDADTEAKIEAEATDAEKKPAAKKAPVRPNPVAISSNTSSTSCVRHSSRSTCR